MRHTIPALVAGILFLATLCMGYGGFEVTSTFNSMGGLNDRLDSLNRQQLGTGHFTYGAPLWWYGGHGGGQVGPVTLGGSGALTWRANQADSVKGQLIAVRANLEVGFPYVPNQWLLFRPCVELGGAGTLVYAQTFSASSKWWFASWTIGATPGVEAMGMLPTSSESFIGLFLKAGYFIPFSGPTWFGDKNPPALSLRGFSLQLGVRFGKNYTPTEEALPGD
ncbi:MAG TPA: hypothetical protein VMH22_02105 [bacterium]|nr:hypothetical protein [bacterium]